MTTAPEPTDKPELYVGTPEQIEEWTGWPGRAEAPPGDVIGLDALESGELPPRPWVEYAEVHFWFTAFGDADYRRASWLREHLPYGVPTRLERFGPEEERAAAVTRAEVEEATASAPEKRLSHLAMERYLWHKADDEALHRLSAEAMAEVTGERIKQTARDFAAVPRPRSIIEGILAAEVNLLAGPEASGKSLWVRDLALCLATGSPWRGYRVPEPRNVLLVFSEGTHDFDDRYCGQPHWDEAADRIWVLDQTVDLTQPEDVDWLLKEYAGERPGLVVFDVIYGCGMADDTGTKDVLPVISALKRISAEWGAATLAVGHPPHGDLRRMRGSSMWRNLAYTDWFMGNGQLTCEKSKIAHKGGLVFPYAAAYPGIAWRETGDLLAEESMRFSIIEASIDADEKMSLRKRAAILAPELGLGIDRARVVIRDHLRARGLM